MSRSSITWWLASVYKPKDIEAHQFVLATPKGHVMGTLFDYDPDDDAFYDGESQAGVKRESIAYWAYIPRTFRGSPLVSAQSQVPKE
jgi:hypothetical protein